MGIQSVSNLRQCLSVLYVMPMLQKFSVLTVRTLSRKQENRGLSSPLWKQELDWLHCICKECIDFYIKEKKGITLYFFPSIFGGSGERNIKDENQGSATEEKISYRREFLAVTEYPAKLRV